MLYRIKSCSVLDFIKSSPDKMEKFKQFKNKDEALLSEYMQEKKRSLKSDNEALKGK